MSIPEISVPELQIVEQATKTWKLDPEKQRMRGYVDGQDAAIQAAYLRLQTPRYQHLIHSWGYGSDLYTLVGQDADYVFSEAKRMIAETLLEDSRIIGVQNFIFDGGVIRFEITTIYGGVSAMEVTM